jgi:hypothetical protein
LKIPKGNRIRILKNRKQNAEKKKIQKDKQRSTKSPSILSVLGWSPTIKEHKNHYHVHSQINLNNYDIIGVNVSSLQILITPLLSPNSSYMHFQIIRRHWVSILTCRSSIVKYNNIIGVNVSSLVIIKWFVFLELLYWGSHLNSCLLTTSLTPLTRVRAPIKKVWEFMNGDL